MDPESYNTFVRAQGAALRAKDVAPTSLKAWQERRKALAARMFAAMGPFPDKPCDLEPRIVGTLKREGYRIEKVVLHTRPGVWASTSLYVPDPAKGKLPAVLAVHGHWAGARR